MLLHLFWHTPCVVFTSFISRAIMSHISFLYSVWLWKSCVSGEESFLVAAAEQTEPGNQWVRWSVHGDVNVCIDTVPACGRNSATAWWAHCVRFLRRYCITTSDFSLAASWRQIVVNSHDMHRMVASTLSAWRIAMVTCSIQFSYGLWTAWRARSIAHALAKWSLRPCMCQIWNKEQTCKTHQMHVSILH